ncbi:hypothetical protein [Mycoplasma simbae]|uniref:hypothetical protein n=1 Tax=Mycoplasma simbae TaxID=36744 RepID=UPI0004969A18|nr:hypothetical protein [Mycoplasma simbae]
MEKNKFVKYKHHAKAYFWTSSLGSIFTVFIALMLSRNYYPFEVGAEAFNARFWLVTYIVLLVFFVFISVYALIVILVMNSFILKLEKIKEITDANEGKKMQQKIEKMSVFLDIFSLNKHLSYNLYLTSKDE